MIKITCQILLIREKEDDDEDEEAEEDPDGDYKKMLMGLKDDKSNKSPFVDKDNFNVDDYKNTFDEDNDDEDVDDYENVPWRSEDPEYDSPLDNKCEILYFSDCLQSMQQGQAEVYDQLISCLSSEQIDLLKKNFEIAAN